MGLQSGIVPGRVSVVTAVHNGDRYLEHSLRSILRQERVDLELIVIDDGSTDSTPEVLEQLASEDSRIRVVRQENRGLTRALIRGCEEASGEYIARHDADDLSLPGRLALELELLRERPELSMAACWSRVIGPEDELLYDIRHPAEPPDSTHGLVNRHESPCHGSVMFRKRDYAAVGRYRSEFRVAQDLDLWLRLTARGEIAYVPQVLYEWRIHDRAISASSRLLQEKLGDLARQCHRARTSGQDDALLLVQASQASSAEHRPAEPATNAYFIGKCLLDRRDRRAVAYLWRSVREAPLAGRRWRALAAAGLLCRANSVPVKLKEKSGLCLGKK